MLSSSKLSRPSVEPKRIDDIFYRLGPTARICLEMIGTETVLKDYEHDLKDSLNHMTADDLERMIYDVSSLSINAVSHKLCLISRKDRDDLQSDRIVGPMTNVIKSRLANKLQNMTQAERIRLYKHFDKVPESRKMAGIYFESAAQHAIQEGTTFELIPMVVLGPNTKRKQREDQARAPLPQYHSSDQSHFPSWQVVGGTASAGIEKWNYTGHSSTPSFGIHDQRADVHWTQYFICTRSRQSSSGRFICRPQWRALHLSVHNRYYAQQ